MADMQASVPELTSRTFSMLGTMSRISSAISTSRWVGAPKLKESGKALLTASSTSCGACPSIIGPQELIKST